jgi:hypothetical protein
MEWDELLALKMRQYFLPSDDKSHGLLREYKNCTKKISAIFGQISMFLRVFCPI